MSEANTCNILMSSSLKPPHLDNAGVVVVGGPLSLDASDAFYSRGVEIKRSMELFVDWLHYEHGGIKVDGKR